jgi:hypothetical protein
MKISELIIEQTIGTTGSTSSEPTQVQPVSQTSSQGQTKSDPQVQQLAALLKQNKVIDNDAQMNTFIGAYTASNEKKTLNPDQQEILGKLAGPLMNNPSLASKIKLLATQKPGMQNQQQAQQPQQSAPVKQGM